MIPKVSQCGVHIAMGDLRVLSHDFIYAQTTTFMEHINVLYPNTVSGDAWLAAADTGRPGDVYLLNRRNGWSHKLQDIRLS